MMSITEMTRMQHLEQMARHMAAIIVENNDAETLRPVCTYAWTLLARLNSRRAYVDFTRAFFALRKDGYAALTAALDPIDLLTLEDSIALAVFNLLADKVDES